MESILLGQTDLKVSNVCLGCDRMGAAIDGETSQAILNSFIENGGNFLDSASVYCKWDPYWDNTSEKLLGSWLKKNSMYGKVVIATKGGHYDFKDPSVNRVNKKEVTKDVEQSLMTLDIDAIDFYYLHRDDPSKPIGYIIDFMEELVHEGKIRYYGASNYSAERIRQATEYAKAKHVRGFSAVSNMWSPAKLNTGESFFPDPTIVIFHDDRDLDAVFDGGMSFIPFCSTAHGYFQKLYDGTVNEKLRQMMENRPNTELYNRLLSMLKESGRDISMQTMFIEYILSLSKADKQIIPITSVSGVRQLEDVISIKR